MVSRSHLCRLFSLVSRCFEEKRPRKSSITRKVGRIPTFPAQQCVASATALFLFLLASSLPGPPGATLPLEAVAALPSLILARRPPSRWLWVAPSASLPVGFPPRFLPLRKANFFRGTSSVLALSIWARVVPASVKARLTSYLGKNCGCQKKKSSQAHGTTTRHNSNK